MSISRTPCVARPIVRMSLDAIRRILPCCVISISSSSSVTVLLDSPSSYDTFASYVENDKQLGLQSMRETAYYDKQSEGTSMFITAMGTMVAFFFFVIILSMMLLFGAIGPGAHM